MKRWDIKTYALELVRVQIIQYELIKAINNRIVPGRE